MNLESDNVRKYYKVFVQIIIWVWYIRSLENVTKIIVVVHIGMHVHHVKAVEYQYIE